MTSSSVRSLTWVFGSIPTSSRRIEAVIEGQERRRPVLLLAEGADEAVVQGLHEIREESALADEDRMAHAARKIG